MAKSEGVHDICGLLLYETYRKEARTESDIRRRGGQEVKEEQEIDKSTRLPDTRPFEDAHAWQSTAV